MLEKGSLHAVKHSNLVDTQHIHGKLATNSLSLLIPKYIARHCVADKLCHKVVRDLPNMIASELFSIRLSQVSAATDNGAHDETVHHSAGWPHTVVFHRFKHTATVHKHMCTCYMDEKNLAYSDVSCAEAHTLCRVLSISKAVQWHSAFPQKRFCAVASLQC